MAGNEQREKGELMSEREGVNIEDMADDLYNSLLELVSTLMAIDPPIGSPMGNLLTGLTDAMEAYEKEKYGDFSN
jgi:hypothetical protein